MNSDDPRSHCVRCGECCRNSSPTLHVRDLTLLDNEDLKREHLYTVRRGELVRDNVQGRIVLADQEMIKVREKGGGCVFYNEDQKACRIYDKRPAQCAGLKCWAPAEFMILHRSPKLQRRDVVKDGVLLGLIEEQEKRCSHASLYNHVRRISEDGDQAVERILDLLKFDYHLRPFLSRKLGLRSEEMDFYFGRPLAETIVGFGLRVEQQSDGDFLLTRLDAENTR